MCWYNKIVTGTLAASLMLTTAGVAQAANFSDLTAAHDKRGNPIYDRQGDCVRTGWVEGEDECAPPKPEKKVEVIKEVTPAHSLEKEQKTVYFEFDKSDITPQAQQKLNTVATALKNSEDVKVAHIVGYADRMGSESYNLDLSQRRAVAIQDYLTSQGYIKTNVADTRWLGESRPTADCGEKLSRAERIACLQPDRKVELEIDYIVNTPTVNYRPATTVQPAQ